MPPLPGFIGPSYELNARSVDSQRCVNLYPQLNELGTGKHREIASLIRTPGLSLLNTLNGAHRGAYTSGSGRVFVVAGMKFYEVTLTQITEWGTLQSGSGRVGMADNGIDVLIVDGVKGYTFKLATGAFSVIADEDFPVASACAFVDQYLVVNQVGTRNFWISALADATDWDGLDFAAKEGAPDELLTLLVDHRELWLFGRSSTEIWFNSGAFDFPFERREFLEYGIAAKNSAAKIDNTVFWLSQDNNGRGIIFRAEGYNPRRVSTHAVEQAISKYGDISGASAYTMQMDGHSFYVLNFPTADTTWVFDASTGLWHERQSYKTGGGFGRHRVETHTFSGGYHVCGDFENGNLYVMDSNVHTDNGNPIRWFRRSPHLAQDGNRMTLHSLQVEVEPGVGLTTGQGSDPQIMMRASHDGGHTWTSERSASMGKIGEYKKRALWRRLGQARDWVIEVSGSDPVPTTLVSALIEVEGLRN